MIIGLASLALATVLSFGTWQSLVLFACDEPVRTVIRCILVAENKRLDKSEFGEMTLAERDRIEEAARLEGLTLEEALERKKGFRYLY